MDSLSILVLDGGGEQIESGIHGFVLVRLYMFSLLSIS